MTFKDLKELNKQKKEKEEFALKIKNGLSAIKYMNNCMTYFRLVISNLNKRNGTMNVKDAQKMFEGGLFSSTKKNVVKFTGSWNNLEKTMNYLCALQDLSPLRNKGKPANEYIEAIQKLRIDGVTIERYWRKQSKEHYGYCLSIKNVFVNDNSSALWNEVIEMQFGVHNKKLEVALNKTEESIISLRHFLDLIEQGLRNLSAAL